MRVETACVVALMLISLCASGICQSSPTAYEYEGKYDMKLLPDVFFNPAGVAIDGSGYIYASAKLEGIRVYDNSGQYSNHIGYPDPADEVPALDQNNMPLDPEASANGFGPASAIVHSPDGQDFVLVDDKNALAIRGHLIQPTGVTLDGDENIVVVDDFTDYLQVFATDGSVQTSFQIPPPNDTRTAEERQKLSGVGYDPEHYYDVLDSGNSCIEQFDGDGKLVRIIGKAGSDDGEFKEALSIAVNGRGDIYVADNGNHRVDVFHRDGAFVSSFPDPGDPQVKLTVAGGLAIDTGGRVYLVAGDSVKIFNGDGKYLGEFGKAPARPAGAPTGNNDATINSTKGPVAVDRDGVVYVVDRYAIKVYKPTGR